MKNNTLALRLAGCALFLATFLPAHGQETERFSPPFDFPAVFSGNFGEIRANHFHGGLDFKTGGATGKTVRALGKGHISRIRVTHGSGYVLHVDYDNGYTTINRHLSAFLGDIASRVEALQYEQESWEVDIEPAPDEYLVEAGQPIALSGNTGYSFGPHLHLDVIEQATGDYVDPLPFFAHKVKDTAAPKAMDFMLFPQPGEGVVDGGQKPKAYPLQPGRTVTAWGTIGAGIRAYDYMEGVRNKYGVHTVVLQVDGKEVFRSVVDRFAYEENRYINSWTYGQYMKSFIDPGNRLRLLHASNGNRGLVTIDEERPYKFVYTLSDALGNTSTVSFTVQGKRMDIAPVEHREERVFRWDKVNHLQLPGLELVVPKGMLYTDAYLDGEVSVDSGDIACTYKLSAKAIPLHAACDMRIALRSLPVADTTKYYVAGINSRGRKYNVGGRYENGVMKARITQLGTYTVAVDTVPPALTPLQPAKWGRTGRIVIKARDKETGVASYRGTIDGKYALFGKPNAIDGNLVCKLDPAHVRKGGRHTLELTVTDACGNKAVAVYEFVW